MRDLKEQVFSRLFNSRKIWVLFAVYPALKHTIRGTLALANSRLDSGRFHTFQRLHFIPNFSLSHFWISSVIRSSQELWHTFEVGRSHPPPFSGGEHRHRQDKGKAIPSPLSGGPAPHADSFSRAQAITPALHWFKAQLSTAVDTDPCCTSDLSERQAQESKGGTSGDHPQSLVRKDTNLFAKAGFAKRLLLESLFHSPLTPSSLHQPLSFAVEKSSCPMDTHNTAWLIPGVGGSQHSLRSTAPVRSTHRCP